MEINKDELLKKLKELLKNELSVISYETWILPLGIKSIEGNHIVFTITSEYQRDFLEVIPKHTQRQSKRVNVRVLRIKHFLHIREVDRL